MEPVYKIVVKGKYKRNFDHTLGPNSCEIPRARAVLPVPGAPAISKALPAIFFARINSTTNPHACKIC
jgi:hypothetical protein